MKILINVDGGIVQSVLIQQEDSEMVKADDLVVAVWDNDRDLSTGDAIGISIIDPIHVDSIVAESPVIEGFLIEAGF